jgi:NCS2 family nucleobase:cation symporter-2
LDHRKVLIVGLGLTFGLSHDVFPNFFRDLPGLAPLAASALAEALIVAIVLNALFRLGMRRTARLTLAPGEDAVGRVHAFCEEQGGAWGARRDVMQRVTAALVEFAEESGELVQAGSEADIEVTFDEFHVGAMVRYPGRALAGGAAETGLPARPVSLEDGELPVDLARRIIRRMADRFASGSEGGRQWLRLGFEH